MPDLTPNLGIKKPLGNENVSRASFNENWDILDAGVAPRSTAQLVKLTGDDGYVTVPVATDLNNLITSGFYYGNNLANAPEGTVYHRIAVMMSSASSGMQEATTTGGNRYIRNMTGGVWSRWVLQLNDNAPTWINLTLTGGTTAFQSRTPRYTKIGNEVIIEGEITAIPSAGIVMATLPIGFRPPLLRVFKCAHNFSTSNDGATIYIQTDGTIFIQAIANTTTSISLMGMSFFIA